MPAASVIDLLRRCEEETPYGNPEVQIASNGAEVIVVSDLHLGPGLLSGGCYTGTENFFADESFRRFLRNMAASASSSSAILVINGDLADFLRTTSYPTAESEFIEWQQLLAQVGMEKTVQELRDSISHKERVFGLQTDDYKSVWKFDRVVRGHWQLFSALAEWLRQGHRIIIVKGNHDLEIYWPAVRNFLRIALARIMTSDDASLRDVLANHVLAQLIFVDHSCVIDGVLYIEHGHRFDRYTRVLGSPVLPDGQQLNLPFGSFFNRYVLNRIELAFPYADNVRPARGLLPLLIRERFFVAMKLMAYQIPLAIRTIPKGYYRYIFGRVGLFVIVALVPLLAAATILFSTPSTFQNASQWLSSILSTPGSKALLGLLALVGSYFLSRLVAYFQLSEPEGLAPNARGILARKPEYRCVTMGHTHNPDQFFEQGRYYFNTGTWIPIVELDTAQVRQDKTYTFLRVQRNPQGEFEYSWLERWNDDAGRADEQVIRMQK